jgi:voltage-gated potassium channel
MYMTVISITSVGFGEVIPITGNVPAEIFTMIVITFGMGIGLYGLSTLTALLIEGELSGILRKKKMNKKIEKLTDHFIVCGGGTTGKPLIIELMKNREAVVLVERDKEILAGCSDIPGLLYVEGDATEDRNLMAAGIERAAGILIGLPEDKDNLFVTMTARMLNKRIRIISKMTDARLEAKLKKAGADSIVSPNNIGALRMASEMIRPTVVDFLDSMLRSKQGNLRIHQIMVSEDSPALDKTLMEAGLEERYGLLVLGARNQQGEIEFNPSASQQLTRGMTLIVMGDVQDIARAREAF